VVKHGKQAALEKKLSMLGGEGKFSVQRLIQIKF
jgi:hypothetical protein